MEDEKDIGPVEVKFEMLEKPYEVSEIQQMLRDTGFWKFDKPRAYFYTSQRQNRMLFIAAMNVSALSLRQFDLSSIDMINSVVTNNKDMRLKKRIIMIGTIRTLTLRSMHINGIPIYTRR